ncbi:phage head closure protein [Methylobacterium isbiliense]|uniref:Head-tail adaptor protein n=1 Tax=Methylobacterium isbiliense TaxID=315478 RepID=A0ABQ4SCE4_9HYPH|nr:phage head closure protein [Methylobacterium isbiliense]MDN3622010.1 phage head closure protein [Methylobacterium isbiliense]GJD99477.1 hypothetical protein GMJLKIPL_1395 [Methylobacterium isbiliense]
MVGAGAMNRMIAIEAATKARDPVSNEIIRLWELFTNSWAYRRDMTAREFIALGGRNSEQTATFTIWNQPGITREMRINDNGQIFEITGIVDYGLKLQLQAVARNSEEET